MNQPIFPSLPPSFPVYLGDDVAQQFLIRKNGMPVDLTGATEILCTLKNDPSQVSATVVARLTNSKISVVNAAQGLILLSLSAADTAGLLVGEKFDLDFTVTNASGKLQTYRVPAGLNVLQRSANENQ